MEFQNRDVTEETADFASVAEEAIAEVASISALWRSAVAKISRDLASGQTDQIGELAVALRDAFAASEVAYGVVGSVLDRCAERGAEINRTDFSLAQNVLRNVRNWLDCWPSPEPGRRDLGRQEIARGEVCSVLDLAGR